MTSYIRTMLCLMFVFWLLIVVKCAQIWFKMFAESIPGFVGTYGQMPFCLSSYCLSHPVSCLLLQNVLKSGSRYLPTPAREFLVHGTMGLSVSLYLFLYNSGSIFQTLSLSLPLYDTCKLAIFVRHG